MPLGKGHRFYVPGDSAGDRPQPQAPGEVKAGSPLDLRISLEKGAPCGWTHHSNDGPVKLQVALARCQGTFH